MTFSGAELFSLFILEESIGNSSIYSSFYSKLNGLFVLKNFCI